MPEKDSEDSFYYLNAYQDDITPGQKMTILHNISFNDWRAGPHIAPLVTLTREEVTQRKEASITLEKELYAQLKKLAAAWDEQAAQTMLLERALEYLQTPEVEHTSNEWKQDKNGIWEISNRTYKMRYKISYEKAADVYLVSWGIIYNAPKQPESNYRNYWGDSIYVARQDKKKYPSMEAAQHYIQGRFDLYCHLFREISPPVPNECRRMFSINGYLAAGYTLAPPDKEEPNKKAVDDLLACLDDADAAVEVWSKQAQQTQQYMKALEYVKTPPTPHTSNRWTVNEYGNHEMSNMVYRFSWREYEHTEWDRTLEKSVPKSWELTWSVTFNTPHNPDYSGDGWKIAGQDRKIFRDRASMEKYLQGRIAAYADLFVEICPPIPTEHKDRFSINGQLMQGYMVATKEPERPDQGQVDALLDCLDDADMLEVPTLAPKKQHPQKENHTIKKKYSPTR